MLNHFDSCWRWLTGRRDSPWYSALRLYPQPQPGDWDAVLAQSQINCAAWSPWARDDLGRTGLCVSQITGQGRYFSRQMMRQKESRMRGASDLRHPVFGSLIISMTGGGDHASE